MRSAGQRALQLGLGHIGAPVDVAAGGFGVQLVAGRTVGPATVRLADGRLSIPDASAESEGTKFEASFEAPLADLANTFDLAITARNVAITEELVRKLPSKIADVQITYTAQAELGLDDVWVTVRADSTP